MAQELGVRLIGDFAAMVMAIRMRHLSGGLVLAAMVFAAWACDQKGIQDAATDEAPLLLDDEPLLLDDGPLLLADDPASSEHARKGADNSRCFVCHINYVKEDIAAKHALADVGCAKCHGVSDAHIADESWASGGKGTPPEIMYVRAKVNPLCLSCHKAGKLDSKQHKGVLAGTGQKKYCTDCHGDHRLPKRKCKWK